MNDKIIENNMKISELLKENEEILIKEGFKPPIINSTYNKCYRISIPSKYIRKNEFFLDNYHLRYIFKNIDQAKNVAYTLQLTDLINYLLNRFNIWGSVEAMIYKYSIIIMVSILESLVIECAHNICKNISTVQNKMIFQAKNIH